MAEAIGADMSNYTPKAERSRLRCPAVASRLGVGLRTVQIRAPEIPGAAKIFGVWTFDPVKLDRYIAQLEAQSCRAISIAETGSGGGASSLPAPTVAEAYERAIARKQRNGSRRGANG